jgi:hypothetical protein
LVRAVRLKAAAGGPADLADAGSGGTSSQSLVAKIHDVQGTGHVSPFSGQDVAGVKGS